MDAIALRRAGFSEGSIVRIKVKNFLTFRLVDAMIERKSNKL